MHLQSHIHFPSIIYWTLFNEGWGQFDTVEMVRWATAIDPSRLWDAASGWVDPADSTSAPSNPRHGSATGYVRPCPVVSPMDQRPCIAVHLWPTFRQELQAGRCMVNNHEVAEVPAQ